jgi:hypothetical protein
MLNPQVAAVGNLSGYLHGCVVDHVAGGIAGHMMSYTLCCYMFGGFNFFAACIPRLAAGRAAF